MSNNSLLNNIFSNKIKSITEVFNSFSCLPKNYAEYDKLDNYKYSSDNFLDCTEDEQFKFNVEHLEQINCLVANSIYDKTGMIWNWMDIFNLLMDDKYSQCEKIQRKVVYSVFSNSRPIGDVAYQNWNGLQIIDLDIKNEKLSDELKKILFDGLKKYNWFLGVCKSASGKGLHVWTKISPITKSINDRRIEYLCNFRHKYSYVYIILLSYVSNETYSKQDIINFMDMAMAKPQQGIFISSDKTALLNTNFKDLRMDVNFEPALNNGISSINWINHPDLKEIFAKLEWFNNDEFIIENHVELSNIDINERNKDKAKGKQHYKHHQRWQLANTLCSLYGYEQALSIMNEICYGTSYRELAGDVKTASLHNKPISIWAVKELNKFHGFNIKINTNKEYDNKINSILDDIQKDNKIDYVKSMYDNNKRIILNINKDQYLGHIKDDIIKNLSKITLLEAGAGYGKTEMIKALNGKTLLILPFTSTIKAKVEADENVSDWLYYYGSKRPTLNELMGSKSISMTIDKFSHLNLFELNNAGFDHIVIDESHLLFTSSFRDVMSPTIQRLANCSAKVIMMTGTPTGELLFFPNIQHIKVIKEDVRIKNMSVYFSPTKNEQTVDLCKHIAEDIYNGKKILFPTNKGNLYFDQIIGLVQQYLEELGSSKQIKYFYYKKSNTGEDSMDSINVNKSIGYNDIIFCTSFLSVGVDICDKHDFTVYFSELWISQDIEQFANRIRNNDLYIKIFLPKKDSNGEPIKSYFIEEPLDLTFRQDDVITVRDLLKTCNDMMDRNNDEYKYNPLIQNILSVNKYLKYDENDCKYYIDETAYHLKIFEDRYTTYAKQLQILLKAMIDFGYSIEQYTSDKEIPEYKLEEFENYMSSKRHIREDMITKETFKFLSHITDDNIDLYKKIMQGDYEIFRGEKYKEDRIANNLYVENIEILERNIKTIISLYKNFTIDNIIEIYKYCVDSKNKRLNFAKLNRIKRFVSLENKRRNKRLDFPILRFLQDTKKWVNEHYQCTKDEIEEYIINYAVKYANSVKDVVIDDVNYLVSIKEFIQDLFNVVVETGRPKQGILHIKMFELLWEKRDDKNWLNIYGDINTKEFFAQQLLDQMIDNDEYKEEFIEEEAPELILTSKLKLSDIEKDIPNIIHKEFDYFEYSKLDGSNNRFLRKQENTKTLLNKPTETPDTNVLNEIDNNATLFGF